MSRTATLTNAELQAATPAHLDHAKWTDLARRLEATGMVVCIGDRWHWRETTEGAEITLEP